MKRILACVTILALVATLSLPIALAQQAIAIGLPNPIFEATEEEAAEASGTSGAVLPEGATDISYSYIKGQEGPVVFQVKFTWKETECTIRVFKGAQVEDLSGMHCSWTTDKKVIIGVCPGRVMYNEGEAGVAMWYDLCNELVYNISMTGDVTLEKLMRVAQHNAQAEWSLVGMPSSFFQATAEEAAKASGTSGAKLPWGATEVVYSFIKGQEEPVVFQVEFTWEEAVCTIRVFKGTQVEDLSGMFYSWAQDNEIMVGIHPGRIAYNEGEVGVVMWYDERNEQVYNISMIHNATPDRLMKLALVNAE